jgi:putative multiple sugar transport system substrate-binding protein
MVAQGARVLVIAAVDGTSLADTLQEAADAGARTLAYDRLIRDTRNVQYFATFDDFKVGMLQATSIEQALDLKGAEDPLRLELFAGHPDDANARLYFDGAMSVLQPYIDIGRLVVGSGQAAFPDQVGTIRWSGDAARTRMDTLLATFYADDRIDAVLSPDDAISGGIIASLRAAGYYTAARPGPVVTGQGADVAAIESILAGEQTSTVFKDDRLMAAQAARMVDQMLEGATVDVNDTTTYKNGVRTVPSFLLDAVLVTKDNLRKELVDSGYYTADELGL